MTIEIPLSQQGKHAGKYVAIVDDIDADLAELRWSVSLNPQLNYAVRTNRDLETATQELMHRTILERMLGYKLKTNDFVDHVNQDGLDNRRCNLRLSTNSQNQANQRRRAVPKSSIYKGVSFHKQTGKWIAQIKKDKKNTNLGYFEDEREAYEAYLIASRELFGEFANGG